MTLSLELPFSRHVLLCCRLHHEKENYTRCDVPALWSWEQKASGLLFLQRRLVILIFLLMRPCALCFLREITGLDTALLKLSKVLVTFTVYSSQNYLYDDFLGRYHQ